METEKPHDEVTRSANDEDMKPPVPLKSRRSFLRTMGHSTIAIAGVSFVGGLFAQKARACSCTDDYCTNFNECKSGTHTCESSNTCTRTHKCSGYSFQCAEGNCCGQHVNCTATYFSCSGGNNCGTTNVCTGYYTCDSDHSCDTNHFRCDFSY